MSCCAREVGCIVAAVVAVCVGQVLVNAQPTASQPADINAQARALLVEAQQFEQARRPREAIARAEQAVALLRGTGGDTNEATLAALGWLADCCERNEDFAKAQKARSEALSGAARLYGKGHWRVVAARVAMEYGKQLAAYSPTQRQQLRVAAEKQREALARIEQGQYASAVAPATEAMNTRHVVLGQWHRDYGLSMAALGEAYAGLGNDAQAEKFLRPAIDVIRGGLGKDNPETTPSIEQLGEVYQRLADFTKAELLYSQAAEVNRNAYGADDIRTARSMSRLGSLYVAMQKYERAEPTLKRAVAILDKTPDADGGVRLTAVSSLGQLYVQMKRIELAEPLLIRAVELAEKRYGSEQAPTAAALGKLGSLYVVKGDAQRAQAALVQARTILEKTVGTSHPDYAANASQLASLYELAGQSAVAEPLLRRSLESALANLEQAAVVQSERQQMAMAEEARRQLDRYVSLALGAAEFREQAYRYLLAWKGSVLARQMAINSLRDEPSMKVVYSEMEKVASELPILAWAKPRPDQEEYWRQRTAALSEKKERLERLLTEKSKDLRRVRQAVTLEQVRGALPAGVVLLDFAACQMERQPSLNKSSANSDSDDSKLLAFIVRSSGPIELIDLGGLAATEQKIDQWRADVESEYKRLNTGAAPAHPEAGAWLRKMVWQPLEDRLGDATTVLISPEGSISMLPFAGLPGRQKGTFLIEDWPIAVISAAQSLPELMSPRSMPAAKGRMLIVDAIDDSDHAGVVAGKQSMPVNSEPKTYFGMRRGMDSQSMRLKRVYQQRFGSAGLTALDATTATEDAFRREAPRNQYLHILAHGSFAGESERTLVNRPNYDGDQSAGGGLVRSQSLAGYHPSLLSSIHLTTVESARTLGEDGQLFASEIQTLDLRGVELVMLSSCQTALGEKAAGEGLVGTQRSFQIAGAKTVVAASWSVSALPTTLIMERFYDNWFNKRLTKLQALREAQIWMLREHGYADVIILKDETQRFTPSAGRPLPPYFWAAFVLSGDWMGRVVGSVER